MGDPERTCVVCHISIHFYASLTKLGIHGTSLKRLCRSVPVAQAFLEYSLGPASSSPARTMTILVRCRDKEDEKEEG